jgi:antitoxin (DNA-binding transcriptional repressor) of toxin-antitoxin stability system
MVVPLPDTREQLIELIERASGGEEIVLSVNDKTRAKLVRAGLTPKEREAWIEELRELHSKQEVQPADSSQKILDELREERF